MGEAGLFEGCLPIEVLARAVATHCALAHEAVGLRDPRTGKLPGPLCNCARKTCGRQLQPRRVSEHLKFGEQARVLRLIPALKTHTSALRPDPPQHLHPGASAVGRVSALENPVPRSRL